MLLHLLSNIAKLPVTKTVVKGSGMGKTIGSVEKHSKCKGTPNETAISERVQRVKDAWQASVKAKKSKDEPKKETTSSPKRPVDVSASSSAAKRTKPDTELKSTTFSSLLKKVQKTTPGSEATQNGDSPKSKSLPKSENSTASNAGDSNEESSDQQDKKGPCAEGKV